ncbi:hypothetical protein DSM107007_51220 [Nostoc sp. PCC 7120 = FACHB-418]|nr:hypothetical protein DSM107007_51220 [Nostoc sp. PCC 7120 = FACHB-418]
MINNSNLLIYLSAEANSKISLTKTSREINQFVFDNQSYRKLGIGNATYVKLQPVTLFTIV